MNNLTEFNPDTWSIRPGRTESGELAWFVELPDGRTWNWTTIHQAKSFVIGWQAGQGVPFDESIQQVNALLEREKETLILAQMYEE